MQQQRISIPQVLVQPHNYGGTTFKTQPMPLPVIIANQRSFQQNTAQQQQQIILNNQQSYLNQISNRQVHRYQQSQEPPPLPDFSMPSELKPQKPWLGDDIYMVAFLLTVELERLREEYDLLVSNVQAIEQKGRGIAILEKELTDTRLRIGDYEKKIALLENDRDSWMARSQTKEKQLEDLKYQNDFSRRAVIDKEIRDLTAKFITDRSSLENENHLLRQELDELKLTAGKSEDLIYTNEYLVGENTRLKEELENFRRGFDELEMALKQAGDLEQENIYLKKQYNDLKDRFLQNNSNDPLLIHELKEKDAEIQRLQQILTQSGYYKSIQQYSDQIEKQQRDMSLMIQENKRLKDTIQIYEQNHH